jgi:hypothetical protein
VQQHQQPASARAPAGRGAPVMATQPAAGPAASAASTVVTPPGLEVPLGGFAIRLDENDPGSLGLAATTALRGQGIQGSIAEKLGAWLQAAVLKVGAHMAGHTSVGRARNHTAISGSCRACVTSVS